MHVIMKEARKKDFRGCRSPGKCWKTEGVAAPGELETGLAYYAENYERWDAAQGERETYPYDVASGACGGLFWNLSEGELKGTDTRLLLTLYDAKDGSCKSKAFTPSELGLSGETGVLQDKPSELPLCQQFQWKSCGNGGFCIYSPGSFLSGELYCAACPVRRAPNHPFGRDPEYAGRGKIRGDTAGIIDNRVQLYLDEQE